MYDNSSFFGDLICEEYDEQNNFMNPQSSFGFLVYYLLGHSFDIMSDACTQFMNDFSILSANTKGLDNFWGVSYNLPRPKLPLSNRDLTDEEYAIYLYLRNCQLITIEDIEVNFNKCFAFDDYQIYFSEETFYLEVTDHLNYVPAETISSNIAKNGSDPSLHFVTNFSADETTEVIGSGLSIEEEKDLVVNIPSSNWDREYLTFLEQYISLKGNVKIEEYNL